jgi:hypothetical protein
VAADWTAEMLERLPADAWHYELVEGRVVRMPPPSPREVWVLWPEQRELEVWKPGASTPRTLHAGDVLEGGEIVPGLQVMLDQLR